MCAVTMEDGPHATSHIVRNCYSFCSVAVILIDSKNRIKYGSVPVKVHNGCPVNTVSKLVLTAIGAKDGKSATEKANGKHPTHRGENVARVVILDNSIDRILAPNENNEPRETVKFCSGHPDSCPIERGFFVTKIIDGTASSHNGKNGHKEERDLEHLVGVHRVG